MTCKNAAVAALIGDEGASGRAARQRVDQATRHGNCRRVIERRSRDQQQAQVRNRE
jgi:hypothetical protein